MNSVIHGTSSSGQAQRQKRRCLRPSRSCWGEWCPYCEPEARQDLKNEKREEARASRETEHLIERHGYKIGFVFGEIQTVGRDEGGSIKENEPLGSLGMKRSDGPYIIEVAILDLTNPFERIFDAGKVVFCGVGEETRNSTVGGKHAYRPSCLWGSNYWYGYFHHKHHEEEEFLLQWLWNWHQSDKHIREYQERSCGSKNEGEKDKNTWCK